MELMGSRSDARSQRTELGATLHPMPTYVALLRAINVTGGLPEYQYATALAFSVLLLMFLLVFLQWGILGSRSYQTITGKGYSPGIIKLGKWRWLTFAICVLFFLLAVALGGAGLSYIGGLRRRGDWGRGARPTPGVVEEDPIP